MYCSGLETPIGYIKIFTTDAAVTSIRFCDETDYSTHAVENPISKLAQQQLNEYFTKQRQEFSLPLLLNGTDFQNKVWTELSKIPYGKSISYLQLAKKLGDAKCIRAAGTANGKNPFAIVIPCHRVVGSNGKLIGYAGGIHRKQWLLEHEQDDLNGIIRLFD